MGIIDLIGSSVFGLVLGIWGHRAMGRRGMNLGLFGGALVWMVLAASFRAALA